MADGAVWPYKTPYKLDRELVSKLGKEKAAILTKYLDDQMKLKGCNEEEAWTPAQIEALKADREKRATELKEHRRLKEMYKEVRWKELQWKLAQEEALEALQRKQTEFTKAQLNLPIDEKLQTPKPAGCMAFVRRLFNRD